MKAISIQGLRLICVLLSVLSLSGCSAMFAQNPGEGLSPVNAIASDDREHLLLFGADVVAYFEAGEFAQGLPEFHSRYQGVDLHFASAESKQKFDQNPLAYLPQYGGYCANGITFGIPWGGNADEFLILDGKLYIFGGAMSRKAFMLYFAANRALADRYWEQEINGANSFWQRARRLVFRVPHYQSGEEQAAAVRAAESPGL